MRAGDLAKLSPIAKKMAPYFDADGAILMDVDDICFVLKVRKKDVVVWSRSGIMVTYQSYLTILD